MNPVEIRQGKSFKGLAAYLLHDVKREGEEIRNTSERVGWVESFNLNGADGDQSWRLMLATANSANSLKEAAGIKKGKTIKNTVYHYSINFNPDDKLSPEIQRDAVKGSLKALGLSDHQALAVEHTDKAHNHIHVMVNLIDPSNGLSAATPQMGDDGKKRSKLSNSQRKLSSWAGKFERDYGLEITEGRLANANKRSRGEKVEARRKSRNIVEQEKIEKPIRRRRDFDRGAHEDRAREIQSRSENLKEQSRIEWESLKRSYGIEKGAIKAEMSPMMKARASEIKELFKPYWSNMFIRHREELKIFEAGDKTAIGRIWHGAAAFRELAIDGDYLGGFVAAFSKENRRNIVLKKHDRERVQMSERLQGQMSQELGKLKADFDRQFSRARERFSGQCNQLKNKQDTAWSGIRLAWREYKLDRAAAATKSQSRQNLVTQQLHRARGRGRIPE